MFHRLREELNGFCDLLFPPACPLCSQPLGAAPPNPFCHSCSGGIISLPAGHCPHCSLPFPAVDSSAHLCAACTRRLPPYASVAAVGLYDATLRRAIQRFKYEAGHYLDRPLAILLEPFLMNLPAPDLVVPVPLHPRRLRQRSYNQALLLAREIGRKLARPVAATLLERVRDTPAQQGLRARERARNLHGAFISSDSLNGERLLLVDDVMTTGATAGACSQALLDAGATEVRVAVVGRAGLG